MAIGVFGEKLGMTHIFDDQGVSIPVTLIKIDGCQISQIKTCETDGYNAIQVAHGEKELSRLSKPLRGHLEKSGTKGFKSSGEFTVENPTDYKLGQSLTLDLFSVGQAVKVTGTSIGKGFAMPGTDCLHVAPDPDADEYRVNGKWTKYVDPNTKCLWWHNDATNEFFFEATGTSRKPERAAFNKSLDKESKTALDEEDGSTEAGDSCTCATFTDDDSICTASSESPPTQALPTGRPGPGYSGLCTHRTYARNLYTEGQLPGILEDSRNS